MPELPEVETIARDLDKTLRGKSIKDVSVNFERIVFGDSVRFHSLVKDAVILSVGRVGKWIRFSLEGREGPAAMLAHLKMTGQFHLGPWPESAFEWPPHARAAFRIGGLEPDTLFYKDIRKFGRIYAFDLVEMEEFLRKLNLAPDPFEMDSDDFHRRLSAKKGRIKPTLLRQEVVAGLGNIYVDECLFAARVSPFGRADSLSRERSDSLLTEARRILAAAIEARGSTVSNYKGLFGSGSFQRQHKVYGRAGKACPRCGGPIEKAVLGGRSTHYCPQCQK